jgi:hypothetical protein
LRWWPWAAFCQRVFHSEPLNALVELAVTENRILPAALATLRKASGRRPTAHRLAGTGL